MGGGDKKRVFSLLNKVFGLGKKPILIRGVPGAPEGRRAVLSAAGTAKECVRVTGSIRFEHIEISGSSGRGLDIAIASSVTLGPGSLVFIEGGVISGNTAEFGGAIAIRSGSVTMSGGSIFGNTTGIGPDVVVIAGGGVFTQRGGTVRDSKESRRNEGEL
jgi:hypothetical protein